MQVVLAALATTRGARARTLGCQVELAHAPRGGGAKVELKMGDLIEDIAAAKARPAEATEKAWAAAAKAAAQAAKAAGAAVAGSVVTASNARVGMRVHAEGSGSHSGAGGPCPPPSPKKRAAVPSGASER